MIAIFLKLGADMESKRSLDNHIVQVPTGEGKSILFGVTAIVLSYLGFAVDCVCYS